VFGVFDADDWQLRMLSVEGAYGGFTAVDLYPDALPALDALRDAGFRVAIVANQPASRADELTALGIDAEVLAMSESMGVAKPAPAFFARTLELMGDPDPASVAYVGDRVDNDVLPAIAAGMRAIWIRRGPWGVIQHLPDGVSPSLVVGSLAELVERIGDAWD
jgi:HAD superfamily hydrolase (TIGR01549 family)